MNVQCSKSLSYLMLKVISQWFLHSLAWQHLERTDAAHSALENELESSSTNFGMMRESFEAKKEKAE